MKRSVSTLTLLSTLALLPIAGCIPSNVVAPEARAVQVDQAKLEWSRATQADLPGFYVSTEISGDSAGALLKAYYLFAETGSYSGAALVVGEAGPRFVVIAEDGRWALSDLGLDLQDGSGPVEVYAAPGHLRLVTPDSEIVFERVEID